VCLSIIIGGLVFGRVGMCELFKSLFDLVCVECLCCVYEGCCSDGGGEYCSK